MANDPSANDPSFTWGQNQELPPLPPDYDENEQWFFQFQEHLLLTVQAIQRLHSALHTRMP